MSATPLDPGLCLLLAPMDGVTDWVYRDLLTDPVIDPDSRGSDSGISLCVSEFVRVTQQPVPAHVLRRHCPELMRGGTTASGVPVIVQILGGAPAPMAATARIAADLGARGIDLNFGCPAKTVTGHDGGASILRTPCRVEAITRAVRDAVPPSIPVSAKVRLGWADANSIETIARAAEAGGASWLTVHARTRLQGYEPPVDWAAIGRARAAVSIPVVANGDVTTSADVRACAEATGCSAFMIGRGSMARPLIFRALRGRAHEGLELPWFSGLLLEYAARMRAAGNTERAALGRVKQWLRLAAPAFAELKAEFDEAKRLTEPDRMWARLSRLAQHRSTEDRAAPDHRLPGPTSLRSCDSATSCAR